MRNSASEELALAAEELDVADMLLRSGRARVALARTWYAAFHAARSQLYAAGLAPRTHAGVQELFNRHFVRSGSYEPGTSRLLARLQKYREEADYSLDFVVDDEGAAVELQAAKAFVAQVRRQTGAGESE